jgi:hypothetical protein
MIQSKQATEGAQKPLRVEIQGDRVKIAPSRQNVERILNEGRDKSAEEFGSIGFLVFAVFVLLGVVALLLAIC